MPRGKPRPARLNDSAWLSHAYLVERRSQGDIAQQLGCVQTTVSRALIELDIPRPPRYPTLRDARWLAQQVEVGHPTAEIAAAVGCPKETLLRYLRCYSIPAPARPNPRPDPMLGDPGWLADQVEVGRSTAEIAAIAGCHSETVRRYLRRHGIPAPGRMLPVFVRYPRLADRHWLRARYAQTGALTIARELGANPSAILIALRRHGIPVRRPGRQRTSDQQRARDDPRRGGLSRA